MPKPKLCVVCGKRKGKHYFGIAKIPVGKGEYKYLYTSKIGKHEYKVVKWTGKEKKVEQWECDKCWNDSKE